MAYRYRRDPREGGVQITTSPDFGGERHQATFSCAHCNAIVIVPQGVSARKFAEVSNFCMLCFRPVCAKAQCQACLPLEKKIEAMERAAADKLMRGY